MTRHLHRVGFNPSAPPPGAKGNEMSTINTAYGRRHVFRTVVYGSATYVNTLPIPSEPHGAWFVMNPQRGWVDVPRNGRTLTLAIAEHNAANPNNYVFA